MFRQIKSALIWAYIYKFRKLLVKIAIVLIFVTIVLFLYGDVVEYLKLTHKLHLLPLIIVVKWLIIFLAIIYILYNIIALKKIDKKQKINKKEGSVDNKRGLTKKEIARRADEIIQRKLKHR